MSIELDAQTQELIEKEIQAGRFQDAAEVVRAAVRHLIVTREDLGHSREEIDAMLGEAIRSLESGEGVDGEEFFAKWETEEREIERRRG